MKIRNISTPLGIVMLLIAVGAFIHFRSIQLNHPKPLVETIDAYPTPEWAKVTYLGYNAFAADFLMTKTQYYYGRHFVTDQTYPLLSRMIRVTVSLNPSLKILILFGDAVLSGLGRPNSVTEANKLLQFAHENIDPNDYRFVFNQGYNYFFYTGDRTKAYKLMYEGAQMPGAPKRLYWLVTKVISEAGRYELGLYYTEQKIKEITDKHALQAFAVRRQFFKDLIKLTKLAKRYKREFGKPPTEDLSSLVEAGYIDRIPKEPYEGRYLYDKEKDLVYSSTGGTPPIPKAKHES